MTLLLPHFSFGSEVLMGKNRHSGGDARLFSVFNESGVLPETPHLCILLETYFSAWRHSIGKTVLQYSLVLCLSRRVLVLGDGGLLTGTPYLSIRRIIPPDG